VNRHSVESRYSFASKQSFAV